MAELHRFRWDVRRQDSWKVTLALWTILAFGIIQGESSIPIWAVILAAVGVPMLHMFWWISPIETRHSADVQNMFHFMESARSILGENVEVRASVDETPKYSPVAVVGAWTGLFQATVTALLAGAFAMSSLYGWFDKPIVPGGQENEESCKQSHGTGAAGTSTALPSPDPLGKSVPVSSGEGEKALQDARRN